MNINLQLPVSITPTCYHRNKGEVENVSLIIPNTDIGVTLSNM